MNDTKPFDSWDDDKVEIIDLPEREENTASYHKPILQLPKKARAFSFLWAVRVGLVLMVSLLVLIILLQTPLLSPSRNNAKQPALPPARLSITGMSVQHGFVYVSASDGSIAAYRASDGKLLWRVPLGTTAYYAIASDQTIYCFLVKGDFGRVEALRASDGALLWTHPDSFTGQAWMLAKDGIVYLNSERGVVYALRGSDGQLLWRFIAGMPMPFDGFLTVNNGIVSIQTSTNLLYLLRASDGMLIYHYSSLLSIRDTIFPIAESGIIYIVSDSGTVQARSANNGSLLWQYNPVKGAGAWSPAIQDGIVYINNAGNGSLQALRGRDGSLLWQFKLTATTSPPLVYHNVVYITSADGSMIALRTNDGMLLWRTQLPASLVNRVFPPVIDNNIIYVNINRPGSLVYAIQASNGRMLWQHSFYVGTPEYAPAINDGVIYLGKDDHSIDAWSGSDARFLWRYSAPDQIEWYPQVFEGIMYVRLFDGTMDVLRISDGTRLWHFPLKG